MVVLPLTLGVVMFDQICQTWMGEQKHIWFLALYLFLITCGAKHKTAKEEKETQLDIKTAAKLQAKTHHTRSRQMFCTSFQQALAFVRDPFLCLLMPFVLEDNVTTFSND